MKHIVSKYDKDTIYGIATQYVNVQRDGEVMRIPFRQIPTVSQVFCEEVRAELMAIYDERYPMLPCPICGKLTRREGNKKYCSEECRKKGAAELNSKYYYEQKGELKKKCLVCDKIFYPPNNRYKYCCEECRRIAAANTTAVRGYGGKRKPKKDPMALARLNQEARSKNLSYGQLQAQKYIERMKKGEQHD